MRRLLLRHVDAELDVLGNTDGRPVAAVYARLLTRFRGWLTS